MRDSIVVAIVGIGLFVGSSMAQSLNVDIGTRANGAPGFGPPSDAFGGAAIQSGRWNNYTGEGTAAFQLVDLTGNLTPVMLTRTLGAGGNAFFDNLNTSGDRQLLFDDYHDLGGIGSSVGYIFQNLAAGQYNIYTYAVSPSDSFKRTDVSIGGNTQTVGGAISVNGFAQGVTHALHTVNHAGGNLTILLATSALPPENTGTVNGFQLVLVPNPGSLALLAIAVSISGARGSRRRTVTHAAACKTA